MTSENTRGTIMSHRYWPADECLRVMTSEPKSACDSGNCLQVEIVGDHVRLWESARPDQVVVTTLTSWQQVQGKAQAPLLAEVDEMRELCAKSADRLTARIAEVAGLRAELAEAHRTIRSLNKFHETDERGLFADVAAGDE